MALEKGWLIVTETITYMDGTLPHILDVEPVLKNQTVVLNGVSKSFAMTGWRIGYCAGPGHLIKAMNKIQSQSTSNPCAPAQYAALAALTGPQDFPETMKEAFLPRRDFFVSDLESIEGVTCVNPSGAFYVFPNFSAYYGKSFNGIQLKDSADMAAYFLDQAKVASVPGIAFGSDDFVRFSFATSMERHGTDQKRPGRAGELIAPLTNILRPELLLRADSFAPSNAVSEFGDRLFDNFDQAVYGHPGRTRNIS